MQNKSSLSTWSTIIFDLGVLLILAGATVHYMHKMDASKEEIEIVRNGFTAILCMVALAGTAIMQRMGQLHDK